MVGGSMFSWVAHYTNLVKRVWRHRHGVLDFLDSALYLVRILVAPPYIIENKLKDQTETVIAGMESICDELGINFRLVKATSKNKTLEVYFDYPVSISTWTHEQLSGQGNIYFQDREMWRGKSMRLNVWHKPPKPEDLIATSLQHFREGLVLDLEQAEKMILCRNKSACTFYFLLKPHIDIRYREWESGFNFKNYTADINFSCWFFGFAPLWFEAEAL